MYIYNYLGISLQQAMNMELKKIVRIWHIPMLHIECEELPNGAIVNQTFVRKNSSGSLSVGVEFYNAPILEVAEFSTLEELRARFPNLFELTGNLYTFN